MDGGGLEAIRRYDPTRYGTVWIAKPESSPAAGPAEAQGQMPLGGGGPMAARHPRALAGFPPPTGFPGIRAKDARSLVLQFNTYRLLTQELG